MNYTNDLNDSSNYSSKKVIRNYKVFLFLLCVLAVCLMASFGIKAYETSQIDPFEKEGSTLPSDYLLDSSKTYFDFYPSRLPSAVGQCVNVTIDTIKTENLISDIKYYNKCDGSNTYVRVCKLESGDYHFEVSLDCIGKTTVAVGDKKEIVNESSIANDVSAKVSFSFKAQKLDSSLVTFGEPVTVWENENDFANYKIIKSTTFYRYRTKLWQWSGDVKTYYPYNFTNSEKVQEYYKESPSSEYPFKEVSQSYSYKWYIQNDINSPRYYYPSGTTNVNEENTYYLVAPVIGAKKDASTKTYASKYYSINNTTSSDFYSSAPSSNATKLLETEKWSDWSNYVLVVPKFGTKDEIELEKRLKLEIVPILSGNVDDSTWSDISSGYLSENDFISKLRTIGYDVNSISDVVSLTDIKYNVIQTYQETKFS